MATSLVPIVEGKAEQETIPILLRRLFTDFDVHDVRVARPFRVKRNQIIKEGELERAIWQSTRDRENAGCVLVIIDADDDCPGCLGPNLLRRSMAATTLPVSVVLANRELEGWFLGAKESLRGLRGIRSDAAAPLSPESIRGAKERLDNNMLNRRYIEVDDQPAFAHEMNILLARERCPSFDKFYRDVRFLLQQVGRL